MARLSFRCDDELVAAVDEARGDVPRELWLRKTVQREVDRAGSNSRAVERALSEAKEPIVREQADPGSVPSSEGVRSAAPAEQPDEIHLEMPPIVREFEASPQVVRSYHQHVPGPNVQNIRSSSQSKRDVRPIPKGGKS